METLLSTDEGAGTVYAATCANDRAASQVVICHRGPKPYRYSMENEIGQKTPRLAGSRSGGRSMSCRAYLDAWWGMDYLRCRSLLLCR